MDRPTHPPEPPATGRLAVIGGGIAGLTTAWLLARRGCRVTLFEAAAKPGGRLRACDPESRFDPGVHLMLGAYRSTRWLIEQLGVNGRFYFPHPVTLELRRPDHSARLHYGRLPGTARYAAALLRCSHFPFSERVRLLTGWRRLVGSPGAATEYTSAEQLLRTVLRPGPAQMDFWRLLAVSIFNTPLAEVEPSLFASVLRRLFADAGSANPFFPRASLAGDLIEPLHLKLQETGCDLRLRTPVQAIELRGDRLQALFTDAGRETYDYYLLALPPERWCGLFGIAAPVSYNAIATVYFQSDTPLSTSPLIGFPGAPVHWVMQYRFDAPQPELYAAVISCFRGGARELAEVWRDFRQSYLPRTDLRVLRRVIHRRATPRQDDAFQSWRSRQQLAGDNWYTLGDWTRFDLPATIEAAVQSARDSVQP